MNQHRLLAAFAAWCAAGDDLVLASVYDTSGSTYSKAGARMLISADGHFQGMLSGGCLEGDLAERARVVADTGRPQSATYDLGTDDEALWGLGVGCDGLMRVLLQPLAAASGYQPFAAMADILRGDQAGVAVTVIESSCDALATGSTVVLSANNRTLHDACGEFTPPLIDAAQRALRSHSSMRTTVSLGEHTVDCLLALLTPAPRVLVLGGGLDAEPVVRMLCELGWRVVVQDHRPAYIEAGDFGGAETVLTMPSAEVATALDLRHFDAAIVMSHHLDTDRAYLAWLAGSTLPYIGLLGPLDRRRRLLADLGPRADGLAGRLHGPVGLDLGGRGPAAIALSIVAELHQALCKQRIGRTSA